MRGRECYVARSFLTSFVLGAAAAALVTVCCARNAPQLHALHTISPAASAGDGGSSSVADPPLPAEAAPSLLEAKLVPYGSASAFPNHANVSAGDRDASPSLVAAADSGRSRHQRRLQQFSTGAANAFFPVLVPTTLRDLRVSVVATGAAHRQRRSLFLLYSADGALFLQAAARVLRYGTQIEADSSGTCTQGFISATVYVPSLVDSSPAPTTQT